jgi:two-component system phosphate regulon sensor histidine kinase PhoR
VRDAELLDQIDKSLEKNQGGILDIEIKAPNFQYYKVSVMPGPKNLLNTSDSVIIFFKDLTDIIKVQKLKSDFVANVSHELRTPLQSIKLGLETINNGHASKDLESQKKILPVVLQQTSRMESIVNDLLSLSRIELQEHIRPSEKVDLNEIISHSIDLNKEIIKKNNMSCSFDKQSDNIKINGDRNRLIEVFNNLIDNAIKYSEKNKKIKITTKSKDNNFHAIVEDEGIGISKENIPQITERFFRVNPAKSKEVGGTGLGLAIVKHIVNQHRAEMSITSELNKGTRISLVFPISL